MSCLRRKGLLMYFGFPDPHKGGHYMLGRWLVRVGPRPASAPDPHKGGHYMLFRLSGRRCSVPPCGGQADLACGGQAVLSVSVSIRKCSDPPCGGQADLACGGQAILGLCQAFFPALWIGLLLALWVGLFFPLYMTLP